MSAWHNLKYQGTKLVKEINKDSNTVLKFEESDEQGKIHWN